MLLCLRPMGLEGREADSKPKYNHCEPVLPLLAENMCNGARRGCSLTLPIASLLKTGSFKGKGE